MIKKYELDGACGAVGGKEKFTQGFYQKTEGKRPLGRYRLRRKSSIKVDLQ
jgi:hypothetical protein